MKINDSTTEFISKSFVFLFYIGHHFLELLKLAKKCLFLSLVVVNFSFEFIHFCRTKVVFFPEHFLNFLQELLIFSLEIFQLLAFLRCHSKRSLSIQRHQFIIFFLELLILCLVTLFFFEMFLSILW